MAAGDAVVGALRVVLGTDTASFEDGLKSASTSLSDFAKKMAAVAGGIELQKLAEEAANKIVELGKASVETAAQIGRMAQQVGLSTEFLSGLTVAAALSDVDVTALGRSVAALDKHMASAATGGLGASTSAFRYLGISVKDLKNSTPEEILNKIADAFQKMPDGMNKTAVAGALFGDRVGRQMIPVLNEGSHGLEEMRKKAESLGQVFNEQVAKDSERLLQNLRLLGLVVQGIANVVAGQFVKSWADSAESLTHFVVEGDKVVNVGRTIAMVLQFISDNSFLLRTALGDMTAVFTQFATKGKLIDFSAFDTSFREMNDAVNASLEGFKKLGDIVGKPKPYDPEEAAKARQYSNEIANLIIKTRELNGGFNSLPQGFVQAALATGKFKDQMQLANMSAAQLAKMFPDLTGKLQQLVVAQTTAEIQTPYEKWLRANQQLMADFKGLSQQSDEFKFRSIQNASAMAAAYATMASSVVGGLAQVFQALGQKSKTAFQVGKALAIADAIINTYKAANMALASPPGPPLSYAYVAGAIATGLANVIKISQTQFTGAAMGGTFKVPGGSMGVDTTMVGMALAPGELVNVTPADQARGGGGSAQEITLSGIRPKDLFTGEMVRGMFDALNKGHADGYKVKFAT